MTKPILSLIHVLTLCLLYVSVGRSFIIVSTSSGVEQPTSKDYEMTSHPQQLPKDNTSVLDDNKSNPNISKSVSNNNIQARTSQMNIGELHSEQEPLKILTTTVQSIRKIALQLLILLQEVFKKIPNTDDIEKQDTSLDEDFLEFERSNVLSSTISNETPTAKETEEDKETNERRVIRSTSFGHKSIQITTVTPASTSYFLSMENSGTQENLKPIQNSSLSPLKSDDISPQTVTHAHSAITSENHFSLRTSMKEDQRFNPTTATNTTNSQTDKLGICHLLTLDTVSNVKNESETRIYGFKVNSCHPGVLDQAYLNKLGRRILERLIDIEYKAGMLRSEIVDKYQLAKNSELLNVISDHGCVSKFPLDSEITAENRTQEIYEFLVKIYALLDMTSIEFEDALNVAPPSFSIPFKYVNGEIKKLQKQIMKVICNTDLLLRSVGVVRRDFPIYSKREESSIFNSRLTFQMNLYANMNRIRDMLEQVKVEAKLTLPSLIF